MRGTAAALWVTASCLVASPLAAQLPLLDLTGHPSAALSTLVSAVSHGAELRSGAFVFVNRVDVVIRSAHLSRNTLVSLGRRGSGPLEYRRPVPAVADGQGGALITEETDYRVLRVSPTGVLGPGNLPLQEAAVRALWIRGVDPQGRIIHWGPVNRTVRGSIPIHR